MTPVESPFHLSPEEIELLQADEDFNALYRVLSQSQNRSFCASHASLPLATKDTFILHTTLLNILLSPLIDVHSIASSLARHHLTLHPRRKSSTPVPTSESDPSAESPSSSPSVSPTLPKPAPSDLELAFRGPSRSSFSWLTCLTLGERSWCNTIGCPSCIVFKIFEAEPYLRAVIAGTRLSSFFASSPLVQGSVKKTDASFFLPVLQAAVAEDDFWGRDFWTDLSTRAADLEGGVRDLVKECLALSKAYPDIVLPQLRSATATLRPKSLFRSLSVSFVAPPRHKQTNSTISLSTSTAPMPTMALKRGASRRQRLPPVRVRITEEPGAKTTQEWVSRLVKGFFGIEAMTDPNQQVDAEITREGVKMKRKRSLTT